MHDTSFNPLLDDNGKVTHIIPEARDITNIKRTESALHQALAELEQLKNQLEDEKEHHCTQYSLAQTESRKCLSNKFSIE